MSQWIKCSEQMPKKECLVLVYTKNSTIRLAFLHKEKFTKPNDLIWLMDGTLCSFKFDDITHWQPLPTPPEGE